MLSFAHYHSTSFSFAAAASSADMMRGCGSAVRLSRAIILHCGGNRQLVSVQVHMVAIPPEGNRWMRMVEHGEEEHNPTSLKESREGCGC